MVSQAFRTVRRSRGQGSGSRRGRDSAALRHPRRRPGDRRRPRACRRLAMGAYRGGVGRLAGDGAQRDDAGRPGAGRVHVSIRFAGRSEHGNRRGSMQPRRVLRRACARSSTARHSHRARVPGGAGSGRDPLVARTDGLGLRSEQHTPGWWDAGASKGVSELLRRAVWISALASVLTLVTSAVGLAGASPPLLVSGPSQLAACSSQDAAQPGRNFLNAEVEPQIAVNGSDMITMWHQDRWSNGGGHGIGVGVSSDGGGTWTESTMPWDVCAPGTPSSLTGYFRNSDPWVSIGRDGIAYASGLSFNIQVPNWANAVAVSRSTDGGATWDHTQPIPGSAFTTFSMSTDKNSTTADPTKNGTAYTVWDTLIEPTDNPDDNPHTASYTGPAYFSKTTDGGMTWSQAKIIINTNQRQQTIGNIIVV